MVHEPAKWLPWLIKYSTWWHAHTHTGALGNSWKCFWMLLVQLRAFGSHLGGYPSLVNIVLLLFLCCQHNSTCPATHSLTHSQQLMYCVLWRSTRLHVWTVSLSCSCSSLTLDLPRSIVTLGLNFTYPTERTRTWRAPLAMLASTLTLELNSRK